MGAAEDGLTAEAKLLLRLLPADGTSIGNRRLRDMSGLAEDAYRQAVDELVRVGWARRRRGRGGSLLLAQPGASTQEPASRAKRPDRRERAHETEEASPVGTLAGPGGLFTKIRTHVATDVGRGLVFERLIKAFLQEDPLFAARFSTVWLWGEWPGRRGEPDTGIDLVAEERDGGVCAIQCKFYGPTTTIGREDIDPFLVASGRRPFTARLFVSTSERWSRHAEKAVADQVVPVQRIGVAELEMSPFDWSRFDPEHPDQLPRHQTKEILPHQWAAIEDVVAGFATSDRGKLVMACGTGKTFTALRLAEVSVSPGGIVVFCVPSISLLSQTLRAWSADATRPLHAIAVCSDAQVTKDTEDIHVYDLALPATTDPATIAEHMAIAREQSQGEDSPLHVIFTTYQSLDRVAEAQGRGLPEFDLLIADEAHRTTGALAADEGFSGFTMVHDHERLRSERRLYMTATPRLYTARAKEKAREVDAVICSMDDENLYGPEFHYLGFGEAVEQRLLSDYRVVVLMVDEGYANEVAHRPLADADIDLVLQDAARLVGCWRGLSKEGADDDEFSYDPTPMRRAVAFSSTINYSRRVAGSLPVVSEAARDEGLGGITTEAKHVDGTMGAMVRDQSLAWLREEAPEGACRVLSNAKCLTEGVDVPALDAVIFTNPRKSQVDVVQAVGRVMRRAPEKRFGYVIIPVAVPAGEDPETVLDSNERYQVVWQVLQALRAHDDRFDAEVNKLDLQKTRSGRIQVVGVGGSGSREADRLGQGELDLRWEGLEDKVYARVVKRCGTAAYWVDWAADVARIAQAHITRIKTAIEARSEVSEPFERFVASVRTTLNPAVSESEAVEMLAQHLITAPVFEALFGDNEFTRRNPVSEAMAEVLAALHEEEAIDAERAQLSDFYRSVRTRAEGIDNLEGRQQVIKELYEIFFRRAFPLAAERLGIVYTPVEIVDFMLKSVDRVLRDTFASRLGAPDVHLLDPFTGTGTYLARALALMDPDDRGRSYRDFLHANEMVLLAYYVAAVNIEQTFHYLRGDGLYEPFPGVVLTDTFQLTEDRGQQQLPEFLRPNSERARKQSELPITVVVTNPPYSVGQGSQNDNNKNLAYPYLDGRIEQTYAIRSSATSKRTLYDSYIRAFRWASDRIGERGIVCFVTNGSFIDAGSSDGFRKALADEFSAIWCLNLRGNQRTSGEMSRREGGKVFGQGSRAPIAITLLVKDPAIQPPATISYHDIGDYLSREEKLAMVASFGDIAAVPWMRVEPNEAGDWINQRSALFTTFPPLGDKVSEGGDDVFKTYSLGVATGRDAWAYNFSRNNLLANISGAIDVFNFHRQGFAKGVSEGHLKPTGEGVDSFVDNDPSKISWTRSLKRDVRLDKPARLTETSAVVSMYRPFCKQWLYFDRQWSEMVYQMPSLFPTPENSNYVIGVSAPGSRSGFSAIITDCLPSLHLANVSNGSQFFPRYRYHTFDEEHSLFATSGQRYVREDALSTRALDSYRKRFGDQVRRNSQDLWMRFLGFTRRPRCCPPVRARPSPPSRTSRRPGPVPPARVR